MKYALLISGQPRNVKEAYEGIYTKVIEPNGIKDIFIHSWIDPDMVGKQYVAQWRRKLLKQQQNEEAEERSVASKVVPSNIDSTILELYNPKVWKFEKPKTFSYDTSVEEYLSDVMYPQDMLSWMYSMWQANLLKTEYENFHKIKYDMVLRIRFDFLPAEPLDLKKFTEIDTIYASDRYPSEIGMNDIWCACNSNLMDIYTSMFLNFENILSDAGDVRFNHEMMLKRWIEVINKIKVERIDFDFGTMLI